MDNKELIQKLEDLNISSKFYSILEKPKEYAYNLVFLNNEFRVYYLERGEQTLHKKFKTIEGANDYLYFQLKSNLDNGFDLTK